MRGSECGLNGLTVGGAVRDDIRESWWPDWSQPPVNKSTITDFNNDTAASLWFRGGSYGYNTACMHTCM